MSIASYLAYPHDGQRDDLVRALRSHPACEVIPSDNAEVLILVTDTDGADQERELEVFLEELAPLQCLAMVYGEIDAN